MVLDVCGLLVFATLEINGHKFEWDILFLQSHSDNTGTRGKGSAMKLQDHVEILVVVIRARSCVGGVVVWSSLRPFISFPLSIR
jgi:hypothetical protein